MQSINFADGYKTYVINNDESRVIRINTADPNLQEKFKKALNALNDYANKISMLKNLTDEMLPETLAELDRLIKEQLDYALGVGTSAVVFGDVSCLTVANDNGETVFETFMEALMPFIKRDVNAAVAAQKKRMDTLYNEKTKKYIDPVISNPTAKELKG